MGEKKNRVTSPADGEAFVTKDGRKLHIIAGRQITGRDIYAAAYLDRETYEEEYFLTVETCTGYIEKSVCKENSSASVGRGVNGEREFHNTCQN